MNYYAFNKVVLPEKWRLPQLLRIMRITAFLLLCGLMQVSAAGFSQKLTMQKKQASLKEIFSEIKKQTGYNVFVDSRLLKGAKSVDASFTNAELTSVLDDVLETQNLDYTLKDRTVIIRRKEVSLIEIVKEKVNSFFQQDSIVYTGRVLDETGKGLPGASVRIKQSMTGVITNELGRFSIKAPTTGAVLFISYIGYINKEVTLTGDNSKLIEARMQIISTDLKQVEVVSNGYQNIAKERATGSFETITAKQLQHSTDPNLLKRLEGITTSMNFNNNLTPTVRGQGTTTGSTASLGNVTIRGKNTLNVLSSDVGQVSGQPLLVIDGIASAYDITQINPNDVETITLLKDAAAASIWGSRAANGVIVVTTKKGSFEKPVNVSFNSNYNITEKPDLFYYKRMSTSDFIDAQRKQFIDRGYGFFSPYYLFADPANSTVAEIMNRQLYETGDQSITEPQANAMLDALRGNDVRNDITKYLLRKSLLQSYSLGVDGGSKNIAYRLSGGYDRSTANVQGYGDNRLTLNYSSTVKLTKNLQLSAGLGYVQQNTQNQGLNTSVVGDPTYYSPYDRLADDNGNPLSTNPMATNHYRPAVNDALKLQYGNKILDMTYKPLEEMNLGFQNIKGQGYNMNMTASYKIISGLSANVTYSYNRFVNDAETYYSKDSYYMRELINRFSSIDPSNGNVSYGIPKGGYDAHQISTSTNNTLRGQLNYSKSWNSKHELNAIAGVDVSQSYGENHGSQVYGYDPDKFSQDPAVNYRDRLPLLYYVSGQNESPIPGNGFLLGYNRSRALSTYANASYTYNNRYTVSGSIRRDGSNTFSSTTNKSGTPFYSFGGLWNIANEPFYTFDLVPILKLRATYGYNGNTNPSRSPVARISGVDYATSVGGYIYNTLISDDATNSKYRPERTGVFNLGLDFGINAGRLSGSFEYYVKNTKDLITRNPLDPSTGFSSLAYNVGDLRGYGIDFSLSSVNIKSDKFNWTSNFLLSHNRVKVKKLYVPGATNAGKLLNDSGSDSYTVGYDLSRLFAYRWAGLDPQTGNPMIYLNGNPVIISDQTPEGLKNYNDSYYSTMDNASYIGSSVPVYFGSFRNTFTCGQFSISANILYKLKYFQRRPINDLFLSTRLFDGQNGSLVGAEYGDRWQKPGDEAHTNVPSLIFPIGVGATDDIYRNADINVYKADHIRLQEINLSYTLNKKNWFLKNPKIYANVNNLGIIWRANKLGVDPDIQDVPQPRTYSFGLSANF